MADNTILDAGTGGDTIRTEDRTTYKTPVSLIDVGGVGGEALIGDAGNYMPTEGAAAENAAAAGNPVLVGARYDLTPRTLGDGDVGAIALDPDGAVHVSDGGNVISTDWNGTAPPIGAGTEAAALRVTVATDSTGVLTVDNAGTFATQVDGAALTALQLIDDVVHSGDAVVSKYAAIGAVYDDTTPGTVTENQAQSLRMSAERYLYTEIRDAAGNERGLNIDASGNATVNVTGVVSVDDNAANLSVDWAGTVPPIGAGTEAAALRVTVATDSTGTLTVDSSQLDVDDLAPTADGVSAALDTSQMMAGLTSLTPKFAIIDAATSGDNTLVAAVASNKIRVLALFLVASAAVTARLESGASGTALTGQMQLAANGGFVLPFNPVGWCETAVNTLLNLELSAATSCDGSLVYVEVP